MKIYSIVQARSRFKCNPCSSFLFFTSRAFKFHISNESIPSMDLHDKQHLMRLNHFLFLTSLQYWVTSVTNVSFKLQENFPTISFSLDYRDQTKQANLYPPLFPFESLNLLICNVVPVIRTHIPSTKRNKNTRQTTGQNLTIKKRIEPYLPYFYFVLLSFSPTVQSTNGYSYLSFYLFSIY